MHHSDGKGVDGIVQLPVKDPWQCGLSHALSIHSPIDDRVSAFNLEPDSGVVVARRRAHEHYPTDLEQKQVPWASPGLSVNIWQKMMQVASWS